MKIKIITLFFLLGLFSSLAQEVRGVVTTNVNVRWEPTTKSGVIKVLEKGKEVIILQTKGSWSFIQDPNNNKKGWISSKFIQSNIAYITQNANVRNTAGGKILKQINKFGLGADVVSKGELMQALKAKIKPEKIVFSGVGKTYEELKFAISKKILLINTESEGEIIEIEKIAKKNNKKVNIGLRFNPDTDAKTLKKISTGKKENKFGLTNLKFLELLKKYKNSRFINIICLSVHIGSQITSYVPYKNMLNAVNRIIQK